MLPLLANISQKKKKRLQIPRARAEEGEGRYGRFAAPQFAAKPTKGIAVGSFTFFPRGRERRRTAPNDGAMKGNARTTTTTTRSKNGSIRDRVVAGAFALALLVAGCAGGARAQDVSEAPEDYRIDEDECVFDDKPEMLLEAAQNASGNFSTLVEALDAVPELKPIFEDKKEKLTVMAPTDEAFETFFEDFNTSREALLRDPDLIKLLLSYHVVPSVVPYSDMESALKPLFMTRVGSLFMTTSVPGAALTLTRVKPEGRDEHVIRIAGYASAAYVSRDTVWACNGLINPINYVLVPRRATVTRPDLRVADNGTEPEDGEGR